MWISNSWRNIFATFIVSLLIILVGIVWENILADRLKRRVQDGMQVAATVSRIRTVFRLRAGPEVEEVTVRYSVGGRDYRATLMSGMNPLPSGVQENDALELYVDPADSSDVATKSGLLSEDKLTILPDLLESLGSIGFMLVLIASTGRLIRAPHPTG